MHRLDTVSPEGVRWTPRHPTGDGILVVAGSSGRIDEARARVFAENGAVAESVRWFGGPGQRRGPADVPLEIFLQRIDDLSRECDRVWMAGTSFGSEAALLCGALATRIEGVIAFAPSDVVWAGYDEGRESSHWSIDGEPLPYVPFDWDGYEPQTPARFRPVYERSLRTHADRVAAASIPVERIRRLVLVAGGDDQVWPSLDSAERIRARRADHGAGTAVVTSMDAGHRTVLPSEPVVTAGSAMVRGGSEAADRRLGTRAWAVIAATLESAR